jgi:DeoR family deoxyribose operon repressor
METRRDDRIAQLLQALKRSDKLHLKEAANLLGVSEMTIRRDLNSESAPVVLLGGYIVLEPRSASHYLISDQKTRLVEEKRKAARLAASWYSRTRRCFLTAVPPRRGLSKPSTAAFRLPPSVIP